MFNWMRNLLARNTKSLTGGRRSGPSVTRSRLRLEYLEDRLTPAVTTAIDANGLLTVSFSAANDAAVITGIMPTGDTIDVTSNGSSVGTANGVMAIKVIDTGTNAGGQSVTFTSTGANRLNIPGAITVTGIESVTLSNSAALQAASFSETGATTGVQINTPGVTTTGNQTYNDPVTVAANTTLNAGAGTLTFGSTVVAAANNLTLVSDAGIAFNGGANSVSGTGTLTLRPATASTSIGVAGDTGNLQINAATLAAVKAGFGQVVLGSATGTGTLSTKATTFSSPVLLLEGGAAGQIVLDGNLTGQSNASLTLNAGGLVTVNAAGVALTTAGQPISITGNVVLGASGLALDTTANGGSQAGANVTVTGAIDSGATPQALTINAGGGNVTLGGVVGGTKPLATLTLTAAKDVTAAAVTAATITQSAGTGTSTFSGLLRATGTGLVLTGTNLNITGGITADAGPVSLTASGTLTVATGPLALNANTLTVTNTGSGTLSAIGSGTGGLVKAGTGTLTVSGTQLFTGPTAVNAGTLLVNGTLMTGGGTVTVAAGATLGGTGTLQRAVVVSGTLSPGVNGPGTLTTGNVTFNAGSTFAVDVNGPNAGTDYDQLMVNGTVALGNATLATKGGFTPTVGQALTLINNDASDAVSGTFSNLSEGALVTVGNLTGPISYVGGDGNDVTLTAAGPASFTGTSAAGNNFVLRRSGNNLQLLDNGVVVDTRALNTLTDYTITGVPNVQDTLTVDLATGGFFALTGNLIFQGGAGGPDAVKVTGGNVGQESITYTAADAGTVTLTPTGGQTLRLNYSTTEFVDLTGNSSTNLSVQLPAAGSQVAFSDGGTNGTSSLFSANGTFTSTLFRDPSTALLLNGGAGNDALNVRRLAGTMANLFVDGGGGTNSLAVNFNFTTAADTVFLTGAGISSSALPGTVFYRSTGGTFGGVIFLTLGSGGNQVFIQGTQAGAPTLVQTGSGNDVIQVSSDPNPRLGLLSTLAAPLTIDAGAGANQLTLSEAASTTADKLWVTSQAVSGDAASFLVFYRATGGDLSRGLNVVAGSGDDTLIVQSQLTGVPTTLNANGGNDTFVVAVSTMSAYSGLLVDGGDGTDTLLVFDVSGGATAQRRSPVSGVGTIQVLYAGMASSTIGFQNLEQSFANVSLTDVSSAPSGM